MEWIPTSERLPEQKDAGYYGLVNVIWKPEFENSPELIEYDGVNTVCHSAWIGLPPFPGEDEHMKAIPDPPEPEPKE